jgi:hypothetical protein
VLRLRAKPLGATRAHAVTLWFDVPSEDRTLGERVWSALAHAVEVWMERRTTADVLGAEGQLRAKSQLPVQPFLPKGVEATAIRCPSQQRCYLTMVARDRQAAIRGEAFVDLRGFDAIWTAAKELRPSLLAALRTRLRGWKPKDHGIVSSGARRVVTAPGYGSSHRCRCTGSPSSRGPWS